MEYLKSVQYSNANRWLYLPKMREPRVEFQPHPDVRYNVPFKVCCQTPTLQTLQSFHGQAFSANCPVTGPMTLCSLAVDHKYRL